MRSRESDGWDRAPNVCTYCRRTFLTSGQRRESQPLSARHVRSVWDLTAWRTRGVEAAGRTDTSSRNRSARDLRWIANDCSVTAEARRFVVIEQAEARLRNYGKAVWDVSSLELFTRVNWRRIRRDFVVGIHRVVQKDRNSSCGPVRNLYPYGCDSYVRLPVRSSLIGAICRRRFRPSFSGSSQFRSGERIRAVSLTVSLRNLVCVLFP